VLPQEAITDILQLQNFRGLRYFENNGNTYRVTALDPRGRPYRLTIDAYNGRIIKVKPQMTF